MSKVKLQCAREVTPGAVAEPTRARIGYLDIKAPFCYSYEKTPQTYKAGLDFRGRIIGQNVAIPYPGLESKHYIIPYLRNVDWAGGSCTDSNQPTADCTGNGMRNSDFKSDSSEIDEYFTSANDEGYQKWAAKQFSTTCEAEVEAEKGEKKSSLEECVDEDTRTKLERQFLFTASHYNPVLLQTTNETYGSYVDLEPNYPTTRRLRPNMTNIVAPTVIVDHLKEEDEIISSMLGIEVGKKSSANNSSSSSSSNLPNILSLTYNPPQTARVVPVQQRAVVTGQRNRCLTFPVYCPTGLELNRRQHTTRSLFSTMSQQQLLTRPVKTPLGKVRHIEKRRICMPCLPYTPHALPTTARAVGMTGRICVESNQLMY